MTKFNCQGSRGFSPTGELFPLENINENTATILSSEAIAVSPPTEKNHQSELFTPQLPAPTVKLSETAPMLKTILKKLSFSPGLKAANNRLELKEQDTSIIKEVHKTIKQWIAQLNRPYSEVGYADVTCWMQGLFVMDDWFTPTVNQGILLHNVGAIVAKNAGIGSLEHRLTENLSAHFERVGFDDLQAAFLGESSSRIAMALCLVWVEVTGGLFCNDSADTLLQQALMSVEGEMAETDELSQAMVAIKDSGIAYQRQLDNLRSVVVDALSSLTPLDSHSQHSSTCI